MGREVSAVAKDRAGLIEQVNTFSKERAGLLQQQRRLQEQSANLQQDSSAQRLPHDSARQAESDELLARQRQAIGTLRQQLEEQRRLVQDRDCEVSQLRAQLARPRAVTGGSSTNPKD